MFFCGLDQPPPFCITGYLSDRGSVRDVLRYNVQRYSDPSRSSSPEILLPATASPSKVEADWPSLALPQPVTPGYVIRRVVKRPLSAPTALPAVSPSIEPSDSLSHPKRLHRATVNLDLAGLASSRGVQTDESVMSLFPLMQPSEFTFCHLVTVTSSQLPGLSEVMPRL